MTDRIIRHLKVNGFPTYLIIDKNSNIIKDDVQDYHSPNLPNILKSL